MDFCPFDNINIHSKIGKVKHFFHPGSTFCIPGALFHLKPHHKILQNVTNSQPLLPREASPPAPFRARVLGGIANSGNVKRKPEPSQFPKQEFHPAPSQIYQPPQNGLSTSRPLTAPTPRPYNGGKWPFARSKNQPKVNKSLSERKSQCLNLKQRAGSSPPWNSKS